MSTVEPMEPGHVAIAIAQPLGMPVAVAKQPPSSGKYGAVVAHSSASGVSVETVAAYLVLPAVQTAILDLDWTPNDQPLLVMAKILAWKALLQAVQHLEAGRPAVFVPWYKRWCLSC